MEKEIYIRRVYSKYKAHEKKHTRWIVPEFTEELFYIIQTSMKIILGEEISSFLWDFMLDQCHSAKYKEKEYKLETIDDFINYLKISKLI